MKEFEFSWKVDKDGNILHWIDAWLVADYKLYTRFDYYQYVPYVKDGKCNGFILVPGNPECGHIYVPRPTDFDIEDNVFKSKVYRDQSSAGVDILVSVNVF